MGIGQHLEILQPISVFAGNSKEIELDDCRIHLIGSAQVSDEFASATQQFSSLLLFFSGNYTTSASHKPSSVSLSLLNIPSSQKAPHCPLHKHLLSLSLQDCNLQAIGELDIWLWESGGHLSLEALLHDVSDPLFTASTNTGLKNKWFFLNLIFL